MANGFVVWEGESRLDGAPIIPIITGFSQKSTNRKAREMLQSYILRRDVPPLEGGTDRPRYVRVRGLSAPLERIARPSRIAP